MSKPTLWPDEERVAGPVDELLGGLLRRRGVLDVLVGDAVELAADDRAARA